MVLLDTACRTQWFEIAKQLRQQPTLNNVVLVAMTGMDRRATERSKEVDYHVVKPGDFGKLLQILATIAEFRRHETQGEISRYAERSVALSRKPRAVVPHRAAHLLGDSLSFVSRAC